MTSDELRAKAARYADWLHKKCGCPKAARRLARDLHRASGTPEDLAFFKAVIRRLEGPAEADLQ